MKFNSRVFWKWMSVGLIINLCLYLAACGWEDKVISLIPSIQLAITAALAILRALGVAIPDPVVAAIASWASQAQTALVEIKGLVQQFKTAAADAKAGLLNEIEIGFETVTKNLPELLATIHVANADTQASVMRVWGVIQGMFEAVISLIPLGKQALATGKVDEKMKQQYKVVEVKADEFKPNFNAAVLPFGKQYQI